MSSVTHDFYCPYCYCPYCGDIAVFNCGDTGKNGYELQCSKCCIIWFEGEYEKDMIDLNKLEKRRPPIVSIEDLDNE